MNAQEAARTSLAVYRRQHPTPLLDFWHKRIKDAAELGRRCQYFMIDDDQLKNEELTIYQILRKFKSEGYTVKFSFNSHNGWEIKISW